jgi:hypothetical protein
MIKIAIIKRLPSGKYRLYSRKKDPKTNQRKNLGTFDSLSAAKKREKQIQFFKSHADDGKSDSKETKMLSDLSNIATYLEEAGFVDKANKVYMVMEAIDGSLKEDYLIDGSIIPDDQRNEPIDYIGGDAIGGGYSPFNIPEAQKADDEDDLDDQTIKVLDKLPKKMPLSKRELEGDEVAARSNGLSGNSPIDNANCGMFQGWSSAYMFGGSGSIENNI